MLNPVCLESLIPQEEPPQGAVHTPQLQLEGSPRSLQPEKAKQQ